MPALLALLLLALAAPALAGPPVSCHCFKDRSFDPASPAAADPYVLATGQNSLLAAAFGMEKKAIVTSKMTGAAGEDLWVAHWAAGKAGLRAEEFLDARSRAGSWAEALAGLGVSAGRLGDGTAEVLARPGADVALARAAVDDVVASRLGVPPADLGAVRALGATDAEAVAAAVLSRLTGRPPSELRQAVAAGKASWGALYHGAGVEPGQIEAEVRRLVH